MASVWYHDRKVTKKVRGHMSVQGARNLFDKMLVDWHRRGGVAERVNAFEALIWMKGELRCGLYVEAHSVPSAAEPGQPRREAA